LPEETPPSKRNNTFNTITGQTVLTGGNPKTPRELQFTFTQEIQQEAVNWDIAGVKMYYRPSTQSFFNSESRLFTAPYTPGTAQTVN